jgi:predicted cupin superfamily sugar epimerase
VAGEIDPGVTTDPDDLVARLGMRPHPEGGSYVETWRGPPGPDGRAVGTAILFLLRAGEQSHWHRVDAAEVWLHHAGAPLELRVADPENGIDLAVRLGSAVAAGELPQAVVPTGAWQSAASIGDWTLVSCVVTPGFEFSGFELAPPGWAPD